MKKRLLSLFLVICMVLGMLPLSGFAVEMPSGAPFTAITTDVGDTVTITDKGTVDFGYYSGISYYHVELPEGATEVYVTYSADTTFYLYNDAAYAYSVSIPELEMGYASGSFATVGNDDGTRTVTIPVEAFVLTDGAGNGIALEDTNWNPVNLFSFSYADGEEGGSEEQIDCPFLSIAIDGVELADDKITFKALFDLGSLESSYAYIHEDVPYYHVVVPCGTTYVDVTYSADTNIFDYGSDAYGYATELEVDAVSSATVKGRTFKDAYTLNEDGTQTVKTPVTGYTFDENGYGMAITLEEECGTYEAVCLFSFEYDKLNHVYADVVTAPTCTAQGYTTYTCTCGESYVSDYVDALGHSYESGTCTVCGEADPDYQAPSGVVIPDGAPYTGLTANAEGEITITEMDSFDVSYYSGVSHYHVALPAGATEVYVTYPADANLYIYNNIAYGYKITISEEGYSLGYYSPSSANSVTNDDGSVTVTIPAEEFLLADGYGISFENASNWNPVNLFTFEIAAGDHICTCDQAVVSDEYLTTAATCTNAASYYYSCTCGKAGTETFVSGDALGHDIKAATCSEASKCQRADCTYTEGEPVGHSYGEGAVTAPTCTENGYTTYTCTVCGDSYTDNETAATGHTYVDGVCACGAVDPDAGPTQIDGVYQIGNADELMWFAENVNAGNLSASAVLTADIDLSGKIWPSIGDTSNKFAGSFDGQGHTVSNLTGEHGLFGYAEGTSESYVTIKNVTVEGNISNTNYYVGGTPLGTGGIVGSATYVNVENCINRANISATRYGAGIVGYVYNTWNAGGYVNITNCGNEGKIEGSSCYVGGILGYAQVGGQIIGCYNTGDISGTTEVGGIVGYLQEYRGTSLVNNCYNTGSVIGSGDDLVAGLIGSQYNGVSVENCYNAGEAYFAVAGNIYNNTASVSNTYYLSTASTEAVPAENLFDTVSVTGKTHEEMRADDFAVALGESFQNNCPYPVLTWQTAVAHDYVKGVCSVCQAEDSNYVPEAEEPEQVDGVYQIGTVVELNWLATYVNAGNTAVSAVLTADIDLENASWTSIGTKDYRFAGTFDGQGHKVTNLFGVNGLFGYARGAEDAYAAIKNVTVDGTIVAEGKYVAGIVGDTKYVTVENCVNLADINTTYNYVGGVIGYAAYTTTSNCGNEGTISGGAEHTAGVVGYNSYGTITNCWNLGDVYSVGNYVGGIAGRSVYSVSSVTGCYNKGTISGDFGIGGVVGYNQSTMSECYNWGPVLGGRYVGGLAGFTSGGGASSVNIANSYNAGLVSGTECVGGVAGFNSTGMIDNSYYLEGTAATSAGNATVKTADEMKSADFVTTLGSAFKQGNLCPILSWQADDAAITAYDVTIPEETGYTVMGPELAIAGEPYYFTVSITEGYMAGENFAVTVNGDTVTSENGLYVIPNVSSDLTITVTGVELEPLAIFTVTLPETGNGYAVKSVDGYDAASVVAKTDYKFTVEFANGFKAGEDFTVKVNGMVLTAVDGVYTIEAVTEDQTITVSGVEMIPYEDTVSVNLTVTYGENQFYVPGNFTEFMMLEDLEVPYFDIGLYDLEDYYYNPYCYVDENGNAKSQTAGNKETAYGVVTVIHTFIYVTEVYYLGYDAEDAGKGISHQTDSDEDGISDFAEVLSWTGGVGSSFMDLWDHGTNLNYYVNYEYPLGREGWGSTSDQIALEDGDVVSVHLIKDKQVSGSNFSFFTANDEDNTFTQDDTTDSITVKQGEEVTLTLYWTGNGGNYTTKYDPIPGWNLYWINADDVSNDVRDWNCTAFAGLAEGELVTDSNGTITLDTTDLEPGIYYIGSQGGLTAGGNDNGDGFVSRGGETGACVFRLIVEAGEGEESGDATVIPAGAPFISVTTDVEGTVTITDKSTVDFGYYSGVSYYHVELPEGATEVYVTYSADTTFYLYNDAAYAYSISIPEFEMGYASGSFATVGNDDGTRTVTIPVEAFVLTNGVGNGIALEDTSWNPVNLFTFSYAEADEEDDVLLGDVNMDGVIDTQDANLVVSYYFGSEELTEEQLKLADVDGNGIIDTQDANLIVSYYYGTIDAFTTES